MDIRNELWKLHALRMYRDDRHRAHVQLVWREKDFDPTIDDEYYEEFEQAHRQHSPTGFEWGYGGSGPADLALNVVQAILEEIWGSIDLDPALVDEWSVWYKLYIRLWDDTLVYRAAYELHQDLKRDVIARVPEEGSCIEWEILRMYVIGALSARKLPWHRRPELNAAGDVFWVEPS